MMTWWMWTIAYLLTGMIVATVGIRSVWSHEYRREADDGEWDNSIYGMFTAATVLWPLAFPFTVALVIHNSGILKAMLTPTVVRKAQRHKETDA